MEFNLGETKIKVNHNLYDLLGDMLTHTAGAGEYDPEHFQDLINYHAVGNLNVDFGDGYEVEFGINPSSILV